MKMHMEHIFFFGIALAVVGLAGIIYCIGAAQHCRQAQISDGEMRTRLDKLVKINLISLMVAMLGGLCAIVAGLLA